MAATFPLNTSQPWTWNGVTYEYDASEDRWFVVSTKATDDVLANLGALGNDINLLNETVDRELETRDTLIQIGGDKNNQQDAAIAELDARLDTISENIGILEFKGPFQYVLEKTQTNCDAAYIACLTAAGGDQVAIRECALANDACEAEIGVPLDDGTFTSVGTLDQAATEELVLSGEDLNGNSFDWTNLVEADDYLELVEETGQDTVLYQVISEPILRDADKHIRVKIIQETGQGDGQFNLTENYEIRVFKKDLGIDLNEADARYVRKPYAVTFSDTAPTTGDAEDGVLRNGELWFDTVNLELFVWNNNSWVTSAKPPTQDIVIQSVIGDVDNLIAGQAEQGQRFNSLVSDLLLENNIYYSDNPPTGDITGTLRDGDIWFDSDELTANFYSGGAWINPDRQSGGDYLERTGGEMTGKLTLKRPRNDAAGNNLVIWGRINGTEGVLLKDYQRPNSQSSQDDYINYYGAITANDHLVNKKYVDDQVGNYLPLTGGELTATPFVVKNSGNDKFRISNSNVDSFKLSRHLMGLVVKAPGQPISGDNSFGAYPEYTNYTGRIQNDTDIVNKKYVDDKTAGASSNFVYVAKNGLWDSDDWQNPAHDGKFSASGQLSNGNHFWYFSDIDQHGKLLNLREFSSSDKEVLYIQIGHYSHAYLNDPNVNRDGMKIVWAGLVEQATRVTTGTLNNKVNTPGWQLFLNRGTGDNSVPGGTITSGGTYYISFGGLL